LTPLYFGDIINIWGREREGKIIRTPNNAFIGRCRASLLTKGIPARLCDLSEKKRPNYNKTTFDKQQRLSK
jgi:hypothetical protein